MKKVIMFFDLVNRTGEVKVDDKETFNLEVEGTGEEEVLDNLIVKVFTLVDYELRMERIKANNQDFDVVKSVKEELGKCLKRKVKGR